MFYPESYGSVKEMLDEALKEQAAAAESNEEGFEDGTTRVLGKKTTDLLGSIFYVLELMARREAVYREDYRMAVVRAQKRGKQVEGKKGWISKGDKASMVTTITFSFWCLNPAVSFDDLKEDARSIVLTSGTLSPMATFASELDVKFPISLEANHVVDKAQVWVATLAAGPTDYSLNAAYRNANTLQFQDEVGRLLLEVCGVVPHGVLLFLPSYKMLNNLEQRWQQTGLWQELFRVKHIIMEPKGNDRLEAVMKDFYSVIGETSRAGRTDLGQTGALFMAVCRGKVSEGMDFADNNARAVICVGIPFPNVKDTLVDLKKKYNDHQRSQKKTGVLSGGEWYEIQAFRALNQALGRCIRHRDDWGAILMVDDRFQRNTRYVGGLSKWVRGRVAHHERCKPMLDSLVRFAQDMKHFSEEREEVKAAEAEEREKRRKEKEEEKEKGEAQEQTGASSGYFSGRGGEEREASTAWHSANLASVSAKLAAAKATALETARREQRAVEGRSNPVNLGTSSLPTRSGTTSSLANVASVVSITSSPFNISPSPPPGGKVVELKGSTSSLLSTSSLSPLPLPSKVQVLPPQKSSKSRKMEFVSDDEEEAVVSKVMEKVAEKQVELSKPKKVSAEEDRVSRPVATSGPGRLARFAYTGSRGGQGTTSSSSVAQSNTSSHSARDGRSNQSAERPGEASVKDMRSRFAAKAAASNSSRVPSPLPARAGASSSGASVTSITSSPLESSTRVTLGEATKRKKSPSPECDFDLSDDFDIEIEEVGKTELVQQKPNMSESDFDLGMEFEEEMEEEKAVPAAPPAARHDGGWLSRPSAGLRTPGPVASGGKPGPLAKKAKTEVKSAEDEFLEDEGLSLADFDGPGALTVSRSPEGKEVLVAKEVMPREVLSVPISSLALSSDPFALADRRLEEKPWIMGMLPEEQGDGQEQDDSAERALVAQMLRRRRRSAAKHAEEPEPSRAVLPAPPGSTRKPLFRQETPAKVVTPAAAERSRWSSGEEVEAPRQARPSLDSADEIDEPEEVERKVGRVEGRVSKLARKKPRLATREVVRDSDEDFVM